MYNHSTPLTMYPLSHRRSDQAQDLPASRRLQGVHIQQWVDLVLGPPASRQGLTTFSQTAILNSLRQLKMQKS